MKNLYSCTTAAYRRIVRDAARAAINQWLLSLPPSGKYQFELDGVECLLEFSEGHWGFLGDGRWRWGRVDAGDPDEAASGENVLLEVALGRTLPSQPMSSARRRRGFPMYGNEAELTGDEIRRRASAAATVNLYKLTLHRLPPI